MKLYEMIKISEEKKEIDYGSDNPKEWYSKQILTKAAPIGIGMNISDSILKDWKNTNEGKIMEESGMNLFIPDELKGLLEEEKHKSPIRRFSRDAFNAKDIQRRLSLPLLGLSAYQITKDPDSDLSKAVPALAAISTPGLMQLPGLSWIYKDSLEKLKKPEIVKDPSKYNKLKMALPLFLATMSPLAIYYALETYRKEMKNEKRKK